MEKCHNSKMSNRMVAFCAIVFSTVCVTSCLVAFPMIFHYIQKMEASVQSDLDLCKVMCQELYAGK